MLFVLIFVAALLLVGVVLRHRLALFRWLFIPASVVAGFVGLILVQLGSRHGAGWLDWDSVSQELGNWPGWLIAVVFAGMLLERKPISAKDSAIRVGRQGLMVWIIVLGEMAIGLLATWLIVQNFYNIPNSFGMLIETGFAGGHGTAAAMGEVFAHPSVGLVGGKDLGMLMATGGLIYGIVTGILWINVGVRLGWVSKKIITQPGLDSAPDKNLDANGSQLIPIGYCRIDKETIDPLLFQVLLMACAVGIGMALQTLVMSFAEMVDRMMETASVDSAQAQLAKRLSVSNIVDFPLFIYTLFGGLLTRKTLRRFGQDNRIDNDTISRLSAMAMDILVVAAIASLNLQAVVAMAIPFSVLFVLGAVWTAICLLVISRWILPPEHWFQLGLINYGMSTGTTATGFVLLRMVDPELESGAAEDYALAAPLSAPFIGGGMVTVALPLLVLERVWIAIPALGILGLVVAMVFFGRRLFYRPQ